MTVSSLKGNPSPESVCRVLQKEQHWVQWVDRAHCSGEKGRTLLLFNPVALMVPPHFKIPLRHTSYDCLVEKTTDPFTRLKESISVTNSSLSGWYGAFSFEWGVARLLGQRRDSLTAPFWLGRYHNILIYDHTSHEWSVDSKEGSAPDDLQEILNQANNNKVPEILPQGFAPLEPRSGYSEKIESIQENIREGNVYQVNYTIPFQASLRADPLSMYCALRKRSPVPYGGYYDVGEILLCLSPELFLSSQGREVLSRPIKGTQPRKEATLHDKNEAQKLLDSEKKQS